MQLANDTYVVIDEKTYLVKETGDGGSLTQIHPGGKEGEPIIVDLSNRPNASIGSTTIHAIKRPAE